jgi:Peptidase family M48
MSVPPEILFDRFFQQFRHHKKPIRPEDPDPRLYKGKKDLSGLPPLVESLLTNIQSTFNEALRNEKQDVPEHKAHPPFHFDYIDSEVPNALAFRFEDFSFIGITMGLVNILWETSSRLSQSDRVRRAVGIRADSDDTEPVHVVLFRIQLSFIITHEYTHHVHGHVHDSVFWDEIRSVGHSGSLEQQMLEADADGYAAYHVLAHLLTAEGRPHAIGLLHLESETSETQDRVLFLCFVAALAAYLLVRSPQEIDGETIYKLTHPPQAARMNLLMQRAISWCNQNRAALADWMTLERFQLLMEAVAEATWGVGGEKTWAAQSDFLASREGAVYFDELDRALKAYVKVL